MSYLTVVCIVMILVASHSLADNEDRTEGLQRVFPRLREFQRLEKRRPSEMSRNGFGANAFSGDFGQFYTMKRSQGESSLVTHLGQLLSICADERTPRHLVATLC